MLPQQHLIPLRPRDKAPRDPGWQTRTYTSADFDPESNTGLRLGTIADVDADAPEAIVAAAELLPPTGLRFGRPSKRGSHFLFCPSGGPAITEQFEDVDGSMIVELRGQSDRGAPAQTMIPPSTHPSGEVLAWEEEAEPASVTLEHLRATVRQVALVALVARHWPAEGRHHARLALAGFWLRAGIPDVAVLPMVVLVMRLTGSDEKDAADVVRDTATKLARGEAVIGGPHLATSLHDGPAVLRRMNTWLGRTEDAELEHAIAELNDRFAVVQVGAKPAVAEFRPDGGVENYLTYDDFRNVLIKRVLRVKGKPRPLADVWLKHPDGRQYRRVVCVPPGSEHAAEIGPNDLNLWRGFAMEPAPGDCRKTLGYFHDVLCAGQEERYRWFMNWSAAMVQRPGQHAYTALALMGDQGAGKSFVGERVFGPMLHPLHFLQITGRDQFAAGFNDHLSGRVLVLADELTWGGDVQAAEVIKGAITSKNIVINRKFLSRTVEPNMLHLIITSNSGWPVKVEPGDRRFSVLDVSNKHLKDIAYFGELREELEDRGGHAALLHELLNWKIDEKALHQPLDTAAKRHLKSVGLSPEAVFFQNALMCDSGAWQTSLSRQVFYESYVRALPRRHNPKSINIFGAFLKEVFARGGCEGGWPLSTRSGSNPRSWVFPDLPTCRAAFDKCYGTETDWPEVDPEQGSLLAEAA